MKPVEQSVALAMATSGRAYRLDAGYLVGADGGRSNAHKSAGVGFPGHTSPIASRITHVHLPEGLLVPGRGYEIPGFGLLPFVHNRFANGTIIAFPIEPDRPLVGTIEYERYSVGERVMLQSQAQLALCADHRLADLIVPHLVLDDGRRVAELLHAAFQGSGHTARVEMDMLAIMGD